MPKPPHVEPRPMNALAAELIAKDKLPPGQAKAIAALLDPKNTTKVAVAKAAGVSRPTLDRALQNVTGQRAIERVSNRQGDKARGLHRISLEKLGQRVEDDGASDQLLLGTAKVTADILAAGIDEATQEVDEHERARFRRWLRRGLARAYRAGQKATTSSGYGEQASPLSVESAESQANLGPVTAIMSLTEQHTPPCTCAGLCSCGQVAAAVLVKDSDSDRAPAAAVVDGPLGGAEPTGVDPVGYARTQLTKSHDFSQD